MYPCASLYICILPSSSSYIHPPTLPIKKQQQGRELTDAEALAGTDQEKLQAQQDAAKQVEGKEEGKEEEEEGDERGEWRTAFSEQGKVYYWNVRTRESTWEKPY